MPDWTREVIKEVALAEHSNDYGETIAQFVREANEYRLLKAKFFNNDLNVTLSIPNQETEQEESEINFADGKKIKYKGGQNE